MTMRFYLDTEFNEAPGILDLISIALVAEDGREFYAVSSEFDESRCNDWVRANVLPKIASEACLTRAEIRDRIRAFVGDLTPEFWAYFADYDWVLFCWLFGAMVDLPKGWPMFCLDMKQVMHEHGLTKEALPAQPDDSHHALADARWLREAHEAARAFAAARAAEPVIERLRAGYANEKRLAEIEALLPELLKMRDHFEATAPMSPLFGMVRSYHEHASFLIAQIRAASAALTAAGIHDDGRSLAERVALFRREADASSEVAERALREREQGARYVTSYREQVDRLRASLDSEKIAKATALHSLDILRRAAVAAVVTMGGKVQDDAGPETIAAALREHVDLSEESGRDFAETQRKMQAEIERLRRNTSADARCPTCGEPYLFPPTGRGEVCSDAFHLPHRDLDILRRAAIAAAALGEEVPDDAGPEAIAAALRRGTKPAAPHEASTYSVTSEAFRADRAGTLREAARRGGVTITDEHGHTHCHIYTGPPPEPVEAHPRFCACHECDAVGW